MNVRFSDEESQQLEEKHRKDRLYDTHLSSHPNSTSHLSHSVSSAGESARKSLVCARMLLVATLLAAGIYPDGHWTRATKLTPANFEGFVESQVDAGKTLFVRWIASEG